MSALYQQQIMQLAKQGATRVLLPAPGEDTARAQVTNPLCGDDCTLQLQLSGGKIIAAAHYTRGCVLCLAAAEKLLLQIASQPDISEMAQLAAAFTAALQDGTPLPPPLALFTPVSARKSRHGCVLLPYNALLQLTAD